MKSVSTALLILFVFKVSGQDLGVGQTQRSENFESRDERVPTYVEEREEAGHQSAENVQEEEGITAPTSPRPLVVQVECTCPPAQDQEETSEDELNFPGPVPAPVVYPWLQVPAQGQKLPEGYNDSSYKRIGD